VKIRRTPARHDNIDFRPLITKVSEILPLSVVTTADKGYDSEEDNHVLVREELHAFSVIPARYEHLCSCISNIPKYCVLVINLISILYVNVPSV
jgi:hypothetical protein